jgi:hypothetical protein
MTTPLAPIRSIPDLTEADLSNLRTACFTSSLRSDPIWADALDRLAAKLDRIRSEVAP